MLNFFLPPKTRAVGYREYGVCGVGVRGGKLDVDSERGPIACRRDRLRALGAPRAHTLGYVGVCDQAEGDIEAVLRSSARLRVSPFLSIIFTPRYRFQYVYSSINYLCSFIYSFI